MSFHERGLVDFTAGERFCTNDKGGLKVETLWWVLLGVGVGCVLAAAISSFFRRDSAAYGEVLRKLQELAAKNDAVERMMRDELARSREAIGSSARENREELSKSLKDVSDSLLKQLVEMAKLQNTYLENLTASNEQKLDGMRKTIEEKLKTLQEDNTAKLEKIRATVEEKLHDTLEKRLGDSFKLVSERLEQVHKGLGEMQNLAAGVGDLKKALVNVKARGVLGEIQLEKILAEILTPEQYEKNFAAKANSAERVEFAVKMPGRENAPVWLPIDAKFPIEDYQRLQEAYEQGEPVLLEAAAKQLENSIKKCAKDICDKYLEPPRTTDFAIMFLPFEGLYAEVLRRTGLFELLMRDYRVAVTGPSTLAAFLSSLQMGFRTLAIEKRSSEVWTILGAVKTEFGKFGAVLEKTRKKLLEASNTIDDATVRTKAIERKLKSVEELPASDESARLLGLGDEPEEETCA